MVPHVLVAEAEPRARAELVAWLRGEGCTAVEAADAASAVESARREQPDVALVAAELPDRAGLDVLAHLRRLDPAPAVVLLADEPLAALAPEALRRGAADLVARPPCAERLREVFARALPARAARRERDLLRDEVRRLCAGALVGPSAALRLVREHLERAAGRSRATALIVGEPGVGKELVARALHARSDRRDGPFVRVRCAGRPEDELAAELLGREPGGADPGREGLLAAAAGGTLYLDEVGDLPPALQDALERALRERAYRRVGGERDRGLDARVVAATRHDLAARAAAGALRPDLLYRLNVLTLAVPPLRERPEDVGPLAAHFLAAFAAELGADLPGFAPDALELLAAHDWPGNARELRNAVERAALVAPRGAPVRADDLDPRLARAAEAPGPAPLAIESLSLRAVEQALIRRVLEETGGNRSRAARILGIDRTTLYGKLRAPAPS